MPVNPVHPVPERDAPRRAAIGGGRCTTKAAPARPGPDVQTPGIAGQDRVWSRPASVAMSRRACAAKPAQPVKRRGHEQRRSTSGSHGVVNGCLCRGSARCRRSAMEQWIGWSTTQQERSDGTAWLTRGCTRRHRRRSGSRSNPHSTRNAGSACALSLMAAVPIARTRRIAHVSSAPPWPARPAAWLHRASHADPAGDQAFMRAPSAAPAVVVAACRRLWHRPCGPGAA